MNHTPDQLSHLAAQVQTLSQPAAQYLAQLQARQRALEQSNEQRAMGQFTHKLYTSVTAVALGFGGVMAATDGASPLIAAGLTLASLAGFGKALYHAYQQQRIEHEPHQVSLETLVATDLKKHHSAPTLWDGLMSAIGQRDALHHEQARKILQHSVNSQSN